MENEQILIEFEGIDSWCRPVFKEIDGVKRYGSVDKLFSGKGAFDEIRKTITEEDLCYFGNHFDCEPDGNPSGNIKIVQEEEKS